MRIWRDGPLVPATAFDSRAVMRLRRLGATGRLLLALPLACALFGDLAAGSRRPYLPAVGPIPIRFEALQLVSLARFILPPLDMGWPTNSPVEIATTPTPPPVLPEPTTPDPMTVGLPPTGATPAGQPPTQVDPTLAATPPEPPPEPTLVQPTTPETEAVSPSRILQYFPLNSAANATTRLFGVTNSTWNGGLGFQPPAPIPSSSATYTVSPPSSK